MPSKKKKKSSRGRARKGSNSKKKEGQEQHGTPDKQMEGLNIDDDTEVALLDEAIKLAAAEKEALESRAVEEEKSFTIVTRKSRTIQCYHGYVPEEDHFIINDFSKTFLSEFISLGGEAEVRECITAAYEATREKYPEVWGDYSKIKQVLSMFLFQGTYHVLEGDFDHARFFAVLAFYLEDYITFCFVDELKATFDAAKQAELVRADEHTLVQYLRRNIPCRCLDEKYKQVKSITKMGFCCNEKCSIPDRLVERRSMFYCTRCRAANYCSRECQKAAWPTHKEICDEHAKARTGLDSRK